MRFRWRGCSSEQAESQTEATKQLDAAIAFAEVLLDEGREELNRADGKASIIMASSGVVFSVLVGSMVRGNWSPDTLSDHPVAACLFWSGVAVSFVGLVLIVWSLLPRTNHAGDRSQLAYFGHVVKYRERSLALRKEKKREKAAREKRALRAAIKTASADSFERTVDQVWAVSVIVHKKYVRIRYCLLCYGFGATVCTGSVIVNTLLD